jgi:Fur family ferric uptake transcriptional regulator
MKLCCINICFFTFVRTLKVIRNTTARKKILEFILSSDAAVSHAKLQDQLSGICDRVTIYRVLERLQNENLIHRIVNVNGVVNYAPCKKCDHPADLAHSHENFSHKHIHFSCVSCGNVSCVDNGNLKIELPSTYEITEYQLTIAGYCPICSA